MAKVGGTNKNLRIEKWDVGTLKPTNTVLILGKRGTGKSVIMKHLCYALRDSLDAVVAFCPTEDSQGSLGAFVPSSLIHDEYDGGVLDNILATQKQQWKRGHGSNVMAIMDDCAYDKKTFTSKSLRNVFMNGRHSRVSVILSVQYSLDFPVDLRSNCDYVIACRENILGNRERLYKHFFGFFPTLDAFSKCFTACTNNYEVMVLRNDSQSNRLEDNVFWWKADPDLPDFKIGMDMWRLHDHYALDDEDGMGNGEDGGADQSHLRCG